MIVRYPGVLEDKFEKIYLDFLEPLIHAKVKGLKEQGEKLLNLETENLIEKVTEWVSSFLVWHSLKIKSLMDNDNLFIKNEVSEEITSAFITTNVGLITDLSETINQTNFTQILERIVGKGLTISNKILVQEIINETKTSKSKAEFWARDQVAKFNKDIDLYKYTNSGITHYFWLTARDERVREEHRVLDRSLRRIGEGITPGEEPRCRCVMKAATLEEIEKGKMIISQVA